MHTVILHLKVTCVLENPPGIIFFSELKKIDLVHLLLQIITAFFFSSIQCICLLFPKTDIKRRKELILHFSFWSSIFYLFKEVSNPFLDPSSELNFSLLLFIKAIVGEKQTE